MSPRAESELHTGNDTEAVTPEHEAIVAGTPRAENVSSDAALASSPSLPLFSGVDPSMWKSTLSAERLLHSLKIKAQPVPAVFIQPSRPEVYEGPTKVMHSSDYEGHQLF